MRFNPLLVVGVLLGVGALSALPSVRESTGVAADESWQRALMHAELALAPLLFLPVAGGRKAALANRRRRLLGRGGGVRAAVFVHRRG